VASQLEETTNSLKRVQEADAQALARTDLGNANLSALVPLAERLINLFRALPITILGEFPNQQLQQIQQHANTAQAYFEEIRKFNIESQNLGQFRTEKVSQLTGAYDPAWQTLGPFVAYAAARAGDFERLEREGRAAVQAITDSSDSVLKELQKVKEQADAALAAAQRAASEQGVSQQATYFRDEAKAHSDAAEKWRQNTVWLAIALGAYAVGVIAMYKLGFLHPDDAFESAQLITGKLLLFAVISYMLLLSARNFLSHTHNAIVNKHRQNALMTFNALAAAAKEDAGKDIVLTHAAACIFAPQETGYAKSSSSQESSLAQAMAGLLATKSEGKT
jgi:ElaB/YqjD/DUF883 family membrane-anchored ribosome-binding protein